MLFSYRLAAVCEMKFSYLIYLNKETGSFVFISMSLFSHFFYLFVTFLSALPDMSISHLVSWFPCGRCVRFTGHRRHRTRRGTPYSNFSDPFCAFERSVNIQHFDESCVLGRPWVDPWSVRIQFQALLHMQPALSSTAPPPPNTSSILPVLLLSLPIYYI